MEKGRWPWLAYNWISLIGAALALAVGFTIIFFLIVFLISPPESPYFGIMLYAVLPAFLVLGLVMIPIGMHRKWSRMRKGHEAPPPRWPVVDLNYPKHRNAAILFTGGTLAVLLVGSVVVYKSYRYTESVDFCGTVCHTVMKPEYTTHRDSPHANARCVDCHVGPGAEGYARSKLAGLHQLYAVTFNTFSRPIPTPIRDLRPIQAQCYHCHWPGMFFGAMQREYINYMYDKDNTFWPVNMLIKTGGGSPGERKEAGIHWHINPGIKIEYAARDAKRQEIPWVRLTDLITGAKTVFEDAASPLTEKERLSAEVRVMDCIDCHNRPTHRFHSPDYEVDRALFSYAVDPALPEIKRVAVEALAADYRSDAEAMSGIETKVRSFYVSGYPDLMWIRGFSVANSIKSLQDVYRRNMFPVMKARWTEYPDNGGHFIFPGCMRCHDGDHKDKKGQAIANDCRACHVILQQGGTAPAALNIRTGIDFVHPVDIGEAWKEGLCFQCHWGGNPAGR